MAVGQKTCFVIAPIGAEKSDVRIRSDQILKYIIAPAAQECGYEAIRADQISEPGIITSQIIQHIVDDPLVIADLTGHNPNVFYELALRHALKKPVVQIIQTGDPIPFDVAPSRMIQVDHHDLDSAAQAKNEIVRQIRSVEKNSTDVDSPISVAIELQFLRQSDNPVEKSNAEIITMLQDLRKGIIEIKDGLSTRIADIENLVRLGLSGGLNTLNYAPGQTYPLSGHSGLGSSPLGLGLPRPNIFISHPTELTQSVNEAVKLAQEMSSKRTHRASPGDQEKEE
jgi:hypothetical protein